jgi:anaerobic selenocysteine-containing dehydrogenase
VHPDDARRLGLADNVVVRVQSTAGEVDLQVRVDDDLMPGVVAATTAGVTRRRAACAARASARA